MMDLIIGAVAGAITIAIAWVSAVIMRRQNIEARKAAAQAEALRNLEKTEESIKAIEELATAADREQELADKLNGLP